MSNIVWMSLFCNGLLLCLILYFRYICAILITSIKVQKSSLLFYESIFPKTLCLKFQTKIGHRGVRTEIVLQDSDCSDAAYEGSSQYGRIGSSQELQRHSVQDAFF